MQFNHPVAVAFMTKLKRILPAAAIDDLDWGSPFLLGSITMTFAETGRIDALSADARDTMYQRLHVSGGRLPPARDTRRLA
ncbi:MAG: hypothetical protein HYX63_08840 [Gammaproteobacteria bacterium]|nr:hypothetical protein [Gammaproteobacteria bacterium]